MKKIIKAVISSQITVLIFLILAIVMESSYERFGLLYVWLVSSAVVLFLDYKEKKDTTENEDRNKDAEAAKYDLKEIKSMMNLKFVSRYDFNASREILSIQHEHLFKSYQRQGDYLTKIYKDMIDLSNRVYDLECELKNDTEKEDK